LCFGRLPVSIALLLQGCAAMFSSRRPLSSFFGSSLALIVAGVTLGPADWARGAFEIVSHGVVVDAAARQTTFTLTFNRPPDFFTVNDLGQPADAFQYFYDDVHGVEGEIDFTGEEVVIIRGPEIHVDGVIPIRDSLNPTGEEFPHAEGWGEKLGEIDYELAGTVLSFTSDWSLLRETDGTTYGYYLFAFESGELTGETSFVNRILVPLPPPLAGAIVLAPAAAIASRQRRRPQK
jgi:hypothetical protein